MADERVSRSAAEIEDAVKNVPSLAPALFPRPELFAVATHGRRRVVTAVGAKAQNAVDLRKDSRGGR
jgi:hypothetical protein